MSENNQRPVVIPMDGSTFPTNTVLNTVRSIKGSLEEIDSYLSLAIMGYDEVKITKACNFFVKVTSDDAGIKESEMRYYLIELCRAITYVNNLKLSNPLGFLITEPVEQEEETEEYSYSPEAYFDEIIKELYRLEQYSSTLVRTVGSLNIEDENIREIAHNIKMFIGIFLSNPSLFITHKVQDNISIKSDLTWATASLDDPDKQDNPVYKIKNEIILSNMLEFITKLFEVKKQITEGLSSIDWKPYENKIVK